MYFRSGLLVLF